MRQLMVSTLCVLWCVGLAGGDWQDGDPYKMHYPQRPDPTGWDVYATWPVNLADDWRCTETGSVSEIHVWGSWWLGLEADITAIYASIRANIPAGEGGIGYSRPGDLLWDGQFLPGAFSVIPGGSGQQGWYEPNTGYTNRPDHDQYHQINIENIDTPFQQTVGEIYWLEISVTTDPTDRYWGWKTSVDHFMDDAVWKEYWMDTWQELRDPVTDESLDLAFVIVPEPVTVVMLACGMAGLVGRRRA